MISPPATTPMLETCTCETPMTNATTLVSAPNGSTDGTANNFGSESASVSADGRYVTFESAADDLAPGDNSDVDNVYVRDTDTNATTLVSAPNGSTDGTTNNSSSGLPSVSADGRYVTFVSEADDLAPGDNSDVGNVYLRDTVTNATVLASAPDGSTDGTTNNDDSTFRRSRATVVTSRSNQTPMILHRTTTATFATSTCATPSPT